MATANLTWDASLGAVSYRVEYKLQSDGSYTLFNSAVTQTSIAIPGLDEGRAYDFRVTSNCASGSASGLVISGSTPCNDVTSLQAAFAGTTATLQWAKKVSAISYKIEYKLQSVGVYTEASGSPLNNSGQPSTISFNVPGLSAGSAYDFRITVNCQSGTSTGSVVSATSSCSNVSNFAVTFS